jgi:hypothetical protein
MTMSPVESSFIAAIGYDEPNRILHVELKNGTVYQYEDVPAAKHAALMAAESKGKHLNAHIKGQHGFTKHLARGKKKAA